MKTPVIIAGVAAIAALAIAAIAIAASSGDDSSSDSDSGSASCSGIPRSELGTPTADTPQWALDADRDECGDVDVDDEGGGAAGSCPAEDVPGISDEERERCFEQDSPGGGAPSPDDAVTNNPSTPQAPPSENKLPGLPDDRRAVEAPIDGLEVLTLESFPPQYMLHVQAGLPGGCAEQYGSEVERVDDVITVTVLNTIPADENVACTMIYGTYEFNMSLGSDFESGQTYTVKVNDREITFTAH